MAFMAQFAGGDPIRTEYTPAANTNAGDIVVLTNSNTAGAVGITTQPIVVNQVGAVEITGGIYAINCNGNHSLGMKVYWDSVLNRVVNTLGVNTINLGFAAEACVINTVCRILHHPF